MLGALLACCGKDGGSSLIADSNKSGGGGNLMMQENTISSDKRNHDDSDATLDHLLRRHLLTIRKRAGTRYAIRMYNRGVRKLHMPVVVDYLLHKPRATCEIAINLSTIIQREERTRQKHSYTDYSDQGKTFIVFK